MKELAREPGKRTDQLPANVAEGSPYRTAIESAGIAPRTATRYQQLAEVPKEIFEEALRDPIRKLSATALTERA